MELVTRLDPQNWPAYWFLGKTQQALGNNEEAYSYFESAFVINPNQADVCRELMMECLQLGKLGEGLSMARRAVELDPDDPGLLSNLGLALFLNADLAEAKKSAEQCLAQSPSDPITENLLIMITEVQNGRRKQPRRISDLMKAGQSCQGIGIYPNSKSGVLSSSPRINQLSRQNHAVAPNGPCNRRTRQYMLVYRNTLEADLSLILNGKSEIRENP